MSKCRTCKRALWDYEIFSNSPDKHWFICGCQCDLEESDDCDEYEEWTEGEE